MPAERYLKENPQFLEEHLVPNTFTKEKEKKIFCEACQKAILQKVSVIKKHISTTLHASNKAAYNSTCML